MKKKKALKLTEAMWRKVIKDPSAKSSKHIHDCACCQYAVEKVFGKEIANNKDNIFCMAQPCNEKIDSITYNVDCIGICPMKSLWPRGCEHPSSPYAKWKDFYLGDAGYRENAEEIADHAKKLLEEM